MFRRIKYHQSGQNHEGEIIIKIAPIDPERQRVSRTRSEFPIHQRRFGLD